MSRMMSSLVPWNDPQQLHNIIINICPEFLTPGAVIDIKNVLILDERIDFVRFLSPIQCLAQACCTSATYDIIVQK